MALVAVTVKVKVVKTVTEVLFFTGGNKKRNFVPETQFEFNNKDLAVEGNVDGIGNIEQFANPETEK